MTGGSDFRREGMSGTTAQRTLKGFLEKYGSKLSRPDGRLYHREAGLFFTDKVAGRRSKSNKMPS